MIDRIWTHDIGRPFPYPPQPMYVWDLQEKIILPISCWLFSLNNSGLKVPVYIYLLHSWEQDWCLGGYANPPLYAKRYASLVRLHNATSATPQSCLCWENHPPPYIHICMCLWNTYCDITQIYKYPDMTIQTFMFNVSHPFYIEPSSRLTRSISHCHR